ncbi:MAG: CRISPR system precrRNA processing endoribonuclease RAMP protein Cas6 [Thermoguttaceae bacterium]
MSISWSPPRAGWRPSCRPRTAPPGRPFAERLHEIARRTPQGPWQGDRLDLARYSGRQQRELQLHGVSGSLALPEGPGPLWPLLAAAAWLHIGKGTVMGLGQLRVEAAGRK